MKQHKQPSTPQSRDEYIYQNFIRSQQHDEEKIDTCTMDPCPMKLKPKDKQPVKCPDCGKTVKANNASRHILIS